LNDNQHLFLQKKDVGYHSTNLFAEKKTHNRFLCKNLLCVFLLDLKRILQQYIFYLH